ncbi:efflux RND transporter periplasmic adaptor subunit [Corynebacterium pseudogenitalium]|uniref:efflux RND transporter periplasmic adaptor subunit n=1 Tax=Corynebacterium pseudogenitalium TaxID=38303 RepID=UPI00210EB34D|nr:HlyD family efflux transporter periplasmic adaptor subunit [Corynebacterium pseudogenitalium]UUA87644.1 HlyD family efflux transporter periplasmic adaptor subunit [Corynebacterium pseudogenitalium]
MNKGLRRTNRVVSRALATVGLGLCILASTAACGFGGGQPVMAADTTELAPRDVAAKVPVTATVEAATVTALTTHLTGPVTALNVKVGQRVEAGQVVAVLDTSGVQREIDAQRAQQISADVAAQNQLEQAQQAYRQSSDAMQRGLNPQVTQAEAALRQADGQLQEATAVFEQRKKAVAAGLDSTLLTQAQGVDSARRDALTAALESVRGNHGIFQSGMAQDDAVQPLLSKLEADERYRGAKHNLSAAQKAYDAALNDTDADLAAKQRAVAQAFDAKAEAAVGLEVAKLAAQQQLDSQAAAVQQAQRGVQAAQAAAGQSIAQLEVDVASGQVRAPIAGVVAEVAVKQGQTPTGYLLSVADPNRLVLRASVKELDSAKMKPGDAVSFTTPGTGAKKFKGRVLDVSSVAETQPAADGASAQAARPEFPVEIEVLGDTEGLKIGGTAKAQITTESAKDALAVPREAVVDENGSYSVYALRPKDDGDKFEVVKTPVKVGLVSDSDVVVEGVEKGTRVLNKPAEYRERVGATVTLVEEQE